jgi:hypothetical protein
MNQRRRTRVESQKSVTMQWPGGEAGGQVVNLSLKGCLITPAQGAALPGTEQPLALTIHLEESAPELDVAVQCRVVRADPEGVALDFSEVSPDSFQHLFRLVQYNAPDPESIEGELGTSAFDPPQDR